MRFAAVVYGENIEQNSPRGARGAESAFGRYRLGEARDEYLQAAASARSAQEGVETISDGKRFAVGEIAAKLLTQFADGFQQPFADILRGRLDRGGRVRNTCKVVAFA